VRVAGGGKLSRRDTVVAVSPGTSEVKPGRLFFIFDSVSNKKLLVDTGSSLSLFPFRSAAKPCGPQLKAANGQRIRCWGSLQHHLLIGEKSFQWQFLQADVSFPILGVDFLRGFQLLVGVVGGHLIPRSTVTAAGGGEIFAVLQHVVQQQLATTAPAIAQQQLATPAPTVALQQLATPAPAIAQQQLAAPAISSATAWSTVAP
jgi:hypothetical protein